MREGYKEISLIQQREIEMRVLGPILRAFCEEFGEERTFVTVRRTMREIAHKAGEETAEKFGGGLDSLRENCMKSWHEGGALETIDREDDEDCCRFDVTKCAFAEVYKELGYGDLGTLVSCDRDMAFIDGFDKNLELVRTKTIMEGADCCDFCYRKK